MQVEDHAGYDVKDVWTRWLPEYDERGYGSRVILCKAAIGHWQAQLRKAHSRHRAVKTSTAKNRWDTRAGWCKANIRRWQNSLREVMVEEGTLNGELVPF